MNKISLLDCTLRDGGYCNQWEFGETNIKEIIKGLIESDIDIIECGFLTDRIERNQNISRYQNLNDISPFISKRNSNKMFVVLMNWDEYNTANLPNRDQTLIDGIRVAFHKKDLQQGLKVCKEIREKGYEVFVQAMVSLNYNDHEFLDLIEEVNGIQPYAFYIADSFGVMKKKSLFRMVYMVEENLSKNIWLGFHSHNNLQLAYANAQCLVDMPMNRNLIIDTSVYGMGRGAGNLNTELFAEYLNENYGKSYKIEPLLGIMDDILFSFYKKNHWGYTLPNYLSAIHNLHPNYASYLEGKKTLTFKDIDKIFRTIDECKKYVFDREYVEKKYIEFLNQKIESQRKNEFLRIFENKKVLLIAPGRSIIREKNKILKYFKDKSLLTISINFNYPEACTDYIFLSNLRRYKQLNKKLLTKCIVTSNIPDDNVYLKVSYGDLLNKEEYVHDNAGLLLINLLIQSGVNEILLAGFDGYSVDENQNYAMPNMVVYRERELLNAMNAGIQKVLRLYGKKTKIEFITKPQYIFLE